MTRFPWEGQKWVVGSPDRADGILWPGKIPDRIEGGVSWVEGGGYAIHERRMGVNNRSVGFGECGHLDKEPKIVTRDVGPEHVGKSKEVAGVGCLGEGSALKEG